MNENDLREALVAIAGEPPTAPSELPADVARLARHRRRPTLLAAAAAVVAAVIGAVAVLDDGSTVRTRPAAGPPPADLVATTLSGAVVIVSSDDGRILRTPAPDGSAAGPAGRSPDGQWVYYGGPSEDRTCRRPLYRVSASDGSPPERVGDGAASAVSPDGSRLAYASGCTSTLVVRTLATGEEQTWGTPEGRSFLAVGTVESLRWSPDGRFVAFDLTVDDALYILDTHRPGDLGDARRLEGGLHAPAWLPDGRIVALRTVEEGERQRIREQVVILDPETRDLTPLFYAAVDAAVLDVDPSGRFVLVVNRRGDLFVSADHGPPRRLDGGFRTAAW